MSAICRKTARSRAGWTEGSRARPRRLTSERYCRRFASVKAISLLQHDDPAAGVFGERDDVMSLGLGGTRQIAGAAGVVEGQLDQVAARHVHQKHLRLGPRKRAG